MCLCCAARGDRRRGERERGREGARVGPRRLVEALPLVVDVVLLLQPRVADAVLRRFGRGEKRDDSGVIFAWRERDEQGSAPQSDDTQLTRARCARGGGEARHHRRAEPPRRLPLDKPKVPLRRDVVERLLRLPERPVEVGREHVHEAVVDPPGGGTRGLQLRAPLSGKGASGQEEGGRCKSGGAAEPVERGRRCALEPLLLLSRLERPRPLAPAGLGQLRGEERHDGGGVVELLAVDDEDGHLRASAEGGVSDSGAAGQPPTSLARRRSSVSSCRSPPRSCGRGRAFLYSDQPISVLVSGFTSTTLYGILWKSRKAITWMRGGWDRWEARGTRGAQAGAARPDLRSSPCCRKGTRRTGTAPPPSRP